METEQYLTFKLEDEVYAVEVAKVREILDYTPITKVPRTPDFMRGVINVRGSVVPVLDLRLKFGMTLTEKSVDTCIIVLEITLEEETAILGALADSVQEVIDLEPGQIEPAPRIGGRINTEFIRGMGKRDGRFIMILDIDKVFSMEDLEGVHTEDTAEPKAQVI
ncbi:MAG: Chemotaxis protein CheW [Syntrophorhabdaceae bacterium PtaU1.Bin034]|nr:MAG: Chemotaxis protein CheW [Syntrophorhabdaceae bacterium PtaU1.Bin034]